MQISDLSFFGEGGGYRIAEILVCPSMHLDRDRLGRDRMVVGLTKHYNRNPIHLDSLGGQYLDKITLYYMYI